jgi:hypothetical protein
MSLESNPASLLTCTLLPFSNAMTAARGAQGQPHDNGGMLTAAAVLQYPDIRISGGQRLLLLVQSP